MVYPDTLRDGDILIYANTLDHYFYGDTMIQVSQEDGTYAYIFLNGQFHGVNADPNAPEILNVRNGVVNAYYQTFTKGEQMKMINRFGDMPKMFGKDFYVILRPSLTLKKSK